MEICASNDSNGLGKAIPCAGMLDMKPRINTAFYNLPRNLTFQAIRSRIIH
jgi:hypothetical protein